jgi:hypothetical protein
MIDWLKENVGGSKNNFEAHFKLLSPVAKKVNFVRNNVRHLLKPFQMFEDQAKTAVCFPPCLMSSLTRLV